MYIQLSPYKTKTKTKRNKVSCIPRTLLLQQFTRYMDVERLCIVDQDWQEQNVWKIEREREREMLHDMTWHDIQKKTSVTALQCYSVTMLQCYIDLMNTWIHEYTPPPSFLPSFLPSSLCRPDPPQSPPIPFLPLVFYMLAPLVTTTWHGSKRETKDKERKGKEKK